MKKTLILLQVLTVISLVGVSVAGAEKIYCKDGRLINAKVLYQKKGTLWIKYDAGSMGIDLNNIEKIEDDNGSIWKYDYRSQCGLIEDFIRQKRYREAVELCGLLLSAFPDNIQIHYLRGSLSQKIGDFTQAAQDYDFLVKNKGADAKIFNNLGAIYAKNNRSQEAEELFARAIEVSPQEAEAHENLAELLMQKKDYARAAEEYGRVLKIEPDNIKAIYNLGVAYLNTADYAKAREQWERSLVINPQDDAAKSALEYLESKESLIAK